MTKLRLQRIKFIREWKPNCAQRGLLFPAEQALVDQIHEGNSAFFKSFAFPYSDNDRYHFYLTFLIEALELLPLKVNLAFDDCWRAFESLLFEKNPTRTKAHEVLSEFCVNYVDKEAKLYHEGEKIAVELLRVLPVQTCEYFVQRVLGGYVANKPADDTKRIIDRLKWGSSNLTFLALLPNIAAKYNAPNSSQDEIRRASMLLRKVFRGDIVSVGSFTGQLTVTERLSILVLGVLYTYRNDRFHGNMQPPFKSSVATLQTYAHAHYMFLAAYFLFLQALHETGWVNLNSANVRDHLYDNIALYETLYGKHLDK